MKIKFFVQQKYFFLLFGVQLISSIIVFPAGDFPLNDDWSYAKALLNWINTGIYDIGYWPGMTLLTQLLWGSIFVKFFGFSFFILRFSSLVSAFIACWVLFLLIKKITLKENVAFIGALIFYFNPVFFNLSFTFMTDVNFCTLLVICIYIAHSYFQSPSTLKVILVLFFAVLLIFLRQFGFIVPLAFLVSLLFAKHYKHLLVALAVSALIFSLQYSYEKYLKGILTKEAGYQYLFSNNFFDLNSIRTMKQNFFNTYKMSVINILVFTFPFSIIYFKSLASSINVYKLIGIVSLCFGLSYFLFATIAFPTGNVFKSFDLGTETFYESLSPNSNRPYEHNFSPTFELIMNWIKLIGISIQLTIVSLLIYNTYAQKLNWQFKPFSIFLVLMILFYFLFLSKSTFFFDRYNLPLILISFILIVISAKNYLAQIRYSYGLVFLLMIVSILGTKDYFTVNRTRWKAYNDLKELVTSPNEKINAGFEPCCWNEGKLYPYWYVFMDLKYCDYLIQYYKEPNFETYKSYEFQKYFPYKMDTLFVFKKINPDLIK